RYLAAYRETVDWMYSDPAALKVYADFAGVTEAKAKRIRDQFFPRSSVLPDEITRLDLIIPDAIDLKFIAAPLGKDQLAPRIQIPPRKYRAGTTPSPRKFAPKKRRRGSNVQPPPDRPARKPRRARSACPGDRHRGVRAQYRTD